MAVICPAVLAEEPHAYRSQMEQIAPFAQRVHIDFMDGIFAPTKSLKLKQAWWLKTVIADLHLMYKTPEHHLKMACKLQPNLVIVHAEADGDFLKLAEILHAHNIKAGVALLADTPVAKIKASLPAVDHVMVFAGSLGYFGGKPDMKLTRKVKTIKDLKPEVEVGWDGGISADNAARLVTAGVDVLNIGGAIQRADDPAAAYAKIQAAINGAGRQA